MPPLSSQRLKRRSTNKALRDLVMELAEERRSRSVPEVETAASMSKSISQNKPPVFTGAGEPAILENWLREFDKIFNVVQCPEHLRVDQAAFYLQEEADYWWSNTRDNLMSDSQEPLQWKEFKRVIREKFYPPHIRKQKSNEFSKLEMGDLTVDEYYKKFMEYVKYCPDDVPTEEQKMQRFELGLSNEIQVHVDSDRYTTLDAMYQRAAQVGSLLHKDKGKKPETSSVGVNSGDKRKENFLQQHHSQQNKKHMGFSNFERNGKPHHRGFNNQKKNGDNNSKERVYFCRRCPNNHPGKDCNGNLVECNVCGKLGHRGFECYAKHGRPNQQNGGQQNVNQKNFGNQRNGSDYRGQSLYQPKNGNGYRSNPSNYKPGESNGRNTGSAGTSAPSTQSTPGRLTAISTKEAENAKDVVTGARFIRGA